MVKEVLKIVTVGRITTQKNPKLFNEIAKSFIGNKEIKFIWIGDGELRNELVSPNIEITGWLSQEGVQEKLKEVDIYLSTSSWEGLSLAILQAMENRLPLILSNCVGNIDLAKENYNGFIFSNKEEAIEKIEKMLQDREKIKEYGENSYQLLKEEFNISKMMEKYKKEYENRRENVRN